MEEIVLGCDFQSMQYFISESAWDHRLVLDQVAYDTNKLFSDAEAALIIDESAFGKRGKMSVGVTRQYNGRLGKIDNSQVGVFAALSDGVYSGFIDARLYLPAEWTNDAVRCAKAKIRESDRVLRTKIELAADMILPARTMKLKFDWVCFDAFYGAAPALLKSTDKLGLILLPTFDPISTSSAGKNQTVLKDKSTNFFQRQSKTNGKTSESSIWTDRSR